MTYTKWFLCISVVLMLFACGDDSSSTNAIDIDASGSDMVVATKGDLPACTDKREGAFAYVKDKKVAYICDNGSWILVDEDELSSSSNGKVESSSATDSVPAMIINDKTIYGVAQKGPFRTGTKVKIYELDAETFTRTGKSFEGKIRADKDGSFVVSGVTMSSPYAFFEVTSSDGFTLKALVDLSDRDTVCVNVLTHLECERIFYLIETGYTFFAAKTLAEVNVLAAFDIEGSFANFEGLKIVGDNVNAELLAVSVLALSYGGESKMAEFLNDFATDIKKDGTWDDEVVKAKVADGAQKKYFEGELKSIYRNILDGKTDVVANEIVYKRYINDFWSRIYGFNLCPASGEFSTANRVKNKNSSIYETGMCFYCHKSMSVWLRGACGSNIRECSAELEGVVLDESRDYWTICSNGVLVKKDRWKGFDNEPSEDGELRENGYDVYKFDSILGRWVDTYEEDRTLMLKGCTFKRHGEISKSPKDGAYYYCDSCASCVPWYNNGAGPDVDPAWRKAVDVDFIRRDEKCEAEDVGRVIDRADSVTGRFYCTVNGWINLMDWSYDVPKEFRFNPNVDYGTMTDERDGKTYKTVKIGDQVWMAENLNYAGPNDDISRCYEDVPATCEAGGRLYSLSVADTVCPSGWHLPKKEEFEILLATVGGIDTASNVLRSISGWKNDYSGSDAYGFSAVPTGGALIESNYGPFFSYSGYNAYFFSSDGYVFSINLWDGILLDNRRGWPVYNPNEALLPVRCVKDAE